MNDEIYQKYIKAGKIASQAREYGKNLIKPEVKFLDVAEKIEEKITNLGAKISFPVNIAINDLAAHYSPRHDDKLVFKKGDLVKLDVGTHVDGYIADTATTIEVSTNNHKDLIDASKDALELAISNMKAGINVSEIGKIVEEKIKSFGYKPINNLTGHSLKRYVLHAGLAIPSYHDITNRAKPEVDDVVAIEPFATDGGGHVVADKGSNIYLCNNTVKTRFIRDKRSKMMYQRIYSKFKSLPFAQRWIEESFGNSDIVLRKLSYLGFLKHYPQLLEQRNGLVSQKEHTVIINEEGCEVTTA